MTASTTQLLRDLKTDPQLTKEFQQDPEKALKDYQIQNPKDWDNWIYRIVVISLGLTLVVIVVGTLIALINNQEIKSQNLITIIASLGSAAIGALAGLLAPSPQAS
jgi:ABC-type sugar transport system permease subunit